MKKIAVFAITLLFGATVAACDNSTTPGDPGGAGDPLIERQLPADVAPDASDVVQAGNAFALDLYGELAKKDGNLFLSPFSIHTAFAMLYAGARGETETQMADVMGYSLDQAKLQDAFHALLVSLDRGTEFGGYRLDVANRLWGQTGYQFLDEYLTVTREKYLAPLAELDFEADPEAARTVINQWVEEQTENLIKNLMPQGSINAMTRLVLTNAIYFKGTWETQFDPDDTQDGPFWTAPGVSITVPTMTRDDTVRIGHGEDLMVLELPYTGRDLSMFVFLPDAVDGLPALEQRLTPENLDAWMQSVADTKMRMTLPRFEVESFFNLNGALADLGMPDVFSPGQADLSGINGARNLFVQAAVHKAFIKVNEEGTEAAAATGISVGITSVPTQFLANHPFLFLIRDNVTGSILFLGRVVDPTA